MINIYILFYAALIPVIGKIADRFGRNKVFTMCILIFMVGALICGLSARIGGFPVLLVGRVIQASGASRMIPVANAEIGTSFPKEKRVFALGVAAAVSGSMDFAGSVLFIVQIILLLLGLKGLDFFNLGTSIVKPSVWIPLVLAVLFTVVFIIVEKKVENPAANGNPFSSGVL